MSAIIVMAAVMVIGKFLALLALWLRLRSRIQWEHAHRQCLIAVARAMPAGSQIHERRTDGSQLTLTLACARAAMGE